MTTSFDRELEKYTTDLEEYGNLQEGEYKGVRWLARRPNPEPSIYWCGYVKIPDYFSEDDIQDVEMFSHGEFTGGFNGMTGFDCAHWGDISFLDNTTSSFFNEKKTYKDFLYVQEILFRMIDCIVRIKFEKFFTNRLRKKCTSKIVSISHLIYQNKAFSNGPILDAFIGNF